MLGSEIIKLLIVSLLSVFLYSIYVKFFKKLTQTERNEGLRTHKIKNGTITMGGIIFLVLPLFFIKYTQNTIPIIIAATGFGLLGMLDDILIIVYKKNDGIPASLKLILEIIISGIVFFFYLKNSLNTSINMFGIKINLKWFYGILILWILVASSNAWNLMDGVDGLCSGCSLLFGIVLMIISYRECKYDILYLLLVFHIVLFVFWCFNLPKAFLFMGDVGSLALGAFYSIVCINLNSISSFIILSSLFIFETLSVILQVIYYKRTNGKRLFKMAPFHHHLEASGLSEIQVDLIFYLIQIVLCLLVVFLL